MALVQSLASERPSALVRSLASVQSLACYAIVGRLAAGTDGMEVVVVVVAGLEAA